MSEDLGRRVVPVPREVRLSVKRPTTVVGAAVSDEGLESIFHLVGGRAETSDVAALRAVDPAPRAPVSAVLGPYVGGGVARGPTGVDTSGSGHSGAKEVPREP